MRKIFISQLSINGEIWNLEGYMYRREIIGWTSDFPEITNMMGRCILFKV